jgi:hypothetical protein
MVAEKRISLYAPLMIRLRCPCGETIDAKDEDTLVQLAQEHLERDHPDLAKTYTREDILFMAY